MAHESLACFRSRARSWRRRAFARQRPIFRTADEDRRDRRSNQRAFLGRWSHLFPTLQTFRPSALAVRAFAVGGCVHASCHRNSHRRSARLLILVSYVSFVGGACISDSVRLADRIHFLRLVAGTLFTHARRHPHLYQPDYRRLDRLAAGRRKADSELGNRCGNGDRSCDSRAARHRSAGTFVKLITRAKTDFDPSPRQSSSYPHPRGTQSSLPAAPGASPESISESAAWTRPTNPCPRCFPETTYPPQARSPAPRLSAFQLDARARDFRSWRLPPRPCQPPPAQPPD